MMIFASATDVQIVMSGNVSLTSAIHTTLLCYQCRVILKKKQCEKIINNRLLPTEFTGFQFASQTSTS